MIKKKIQSIFLATMQFFFNANKDFYKDELYFSVVTGNKDKVEQLLATKMFDLEEQYRGTTLLIKACENSSPLVSLLLEKGADPNHCNPHCNTSPLIAAVESVTNKDVDQSIAYDNVQSLILYGADIDLTNRGGFTPLHQAVFTDNPAMIQLLLIYGAAIYLSNNTGTSAWDYAKMGAGKNQNDKIVTIFQEHFNLLNQAEKPTKELFLQAITLGDYHMVNLLMCKEIHPVSDDLAMVKKIYQEAIARQSFTSTDFSIRAYRAIGRKFLTYLRLIGPHGNKIYPPISKSGIVGFFPKDIVQEIGWRVAIQDTIY